MQRVYINGQFAGYVCQKHGRVHGVHAPRKIKRIREGSERSVFTDFLAFSSLMIAVYIVMWGYALIF